MFQEHVNMLSCCPGNCYLCPSCSYTLVLLDIENIVGGSPLSDYGGSLILTVALLMALGH